MRLYILIPALLAILASPLSIHAHGGADHAHPPAAPAPAGEVARRLPDGSLFMPKAMQHRLGVRTRPARVERHAEAFELAGVVVADPRAAAKVAAGQSGRIEAPDAGLPVPGQRVRRGERLAWLVPLASRLERAELDARLAGLAAELRLAEARHERYRQLEGVVAGKEIEAARVELESMRQRRDRLVAGASGREPVLAPVNGVIAASPVVPGQVVNAGDTLFELIDPERLVVEVLTHDAGLPARVVGAHARLAEDEVRLRFLGSSPRLRDLAWPMRFRREAGGGALAVGQSVTVVVVSDRILKGGAVPRAAVARDASGESLAWIKLGPERFAPRRVGVRALDAKRVLIVSGVDEGERVVVEAASLLGQVR